MNTDCGVMNFGQSNVSPTTRLSQQCSELSHYLARKCSMPEMCRIFSSNIGRQQHSDNSCHQFLHQVPKVDDGTAESGYGSLAKVAP